jgi:phosphatidylserine/phosphatidylglycerophosphate/cardiolipin synthase-like enzyme
MSISFANPGTVTSDFIERILVLGTTRSPISFAPNGLFEFRPALHAAIMAAQRYIYIEDQSFSAIEVMEWINQRLKVIPELKVIFVWGPDTSDPPTSFPHQAISNTLLAGVNDANARIRVFQRKPLIVHSKITIVDDVWAAIGSANCMRRSLYTDVELSVSVMEDSPTPFAKVLRKDLWGELCGLAGPEREPLLDLEASLAMVDQSWSTATPPPGLHFTSNLVRLRLPFEYADPPAEGQWKGTAAPIFNSFDYDLKEADSR